MLKPRLRFFRGMWHCGIPGKAMFHWSVASTPKQAYELWARCLS